MAILRLLKLLLNLAQLTLVRRLLLGQLSFETANLALKVFQLGVGGARLLLILVALRCRVNWWTLRLSACRLDLVSLHIVKKN